MDGVCRKTSDDAPNTRARGPKTRVVGRYRETDRRKMDAGRRKGTPIPPKRGRAFRHLSRQLALPTTLAGDLVREKDLHERLIRHVAFVGQGLELLEQRDRQTNGDGRRGGAEVW